MITPLLIIVLAVLQIAVLVILLECIHRTQHCPVLGLSSQARSVPSPTVSFGFSPERNRLHGQRGKRPTWESIKDKVAQDWAEDFFWLAGRKLKHNASLEEAKEWIATYLRCTLQDAFEALAYEHIFTDPSRN